MDKIFELKNCVQKIGKDIFKFFERNNNASGVRARKKLQKLKKIAQEIRILIQIKKKDHIQKKKAKEAMAAAIFAGRFFLKKKIDFKIDLIKTHKNNDLVKIKFSPIRVRKNFNRYRRILNYFEYDKYFFGRFRKFYCFLQYPPLTISYLSLKQAYDKTIILKKFKTSLNLFNYQID
jgi:hypothetical protein